MDPRDREPVDLGDTPSEEGISEADAAERVHHDPAGEPNFDDQRNEPGIAVADAEWPEEH
jgi:hypothetical protein